MRSSNVICQLCKSGSARLAIIRHGWFLLRVIPLVLVGRFFFSAGNDNYAKLASFSVNSRCHLSDTSF